MQIITSGKVFSLIQGRFSRDFIWNCSSFAVLGICGIIVHFLIARFRGPETLGVFNQVFAFYIFASQICTGGIQFSVLRYVSIYQEDTAKCLEITTSALVLGIVMATVTCILAWQVRQPIGTILGSRGVAQGLKFAVPGLFFFALNKILLNGINGLRHMRAYAIFNALRYILILIGVAGLIAIGYPGERLAASLTLAEASLFFPLSIYCWKRLYEFRLPPSTAVWLRKHTTIGFRGFFIGIFTEINTRIDILMLGYFSDDKTVGVYSLAAILAEGFSQISHVLRRNITPILGMFYAERKLNDIAAFSRRMKRYIYPINSVVAVAAVLIYPFVLIWIVGGSEFSGSWLVFSILMTGVVLNSGYRPFMDILLIGNFPGRQSLLIGCLILANIALNAVLIPFIGMYGAAAATALIYLAEAFLIAAFSWKLLRVRL